MMRGPLIGGNADCNAIVCGPVPIAKAMSSEPGFAFALRIAWRRLSTPLSLLFLTRKVLAWPSAAHSNAAGSMSGQKIFGWTVRNMGIPRIGMGDKNAVA